MLGETREEIAAEKLAVVQPGAAVVLGEPEWQALARSSGAATTVLTGRSNVALAVAAAETFLGRPVDPSAADAVSLPGRLERRGESPLEIWDGAHNLDGVGWLASPPARPALRRRRLDPPGQGRRGHARRAVRASGDTVVATASANPRALPADELATLARPWFEKTETEQDPGGALARARSIAGPDGAVLVTGSLYLLADLTARREDVPSSTGRG